MFAFSSASHDVSRASRCCGSMQRASLGEMLKNDVSNWSTPVRKPPRAEATLPVPSPSTNSPAFHRSGGTGVIADLAESRYSAKASMVALPPGMRRPIPTIAMGSCFSTVNCAIRDEYSRMTARAASSSASIVMALSFLRGVGRGTGSEGAAGGAAAQRVVAVAERLEGGQAAPAERDGRPSGIDLLAVSVLELVGTPY